LESVVVSVTQVRAGTTYNIIPGEAHLAGTVRTLKPEVRQLAERRLGEIAAAVAEAHGCRAEVDHQRGYPATVNDPAAVETFRTVAEQAIGHERVIDIEQPVMGGEDFAYYGQVVPSCFFVVGLVPHGATAVSELHQPTFDFNDDAIATGVEMFCRLALHEAAGGGRD
jgi:amidohydrolase